MKISLTAKYTVCPIPASLQFTCNEETVIFHKASGNIHLVNALGKKILDIISQKPLSRDELFDILAIQSVSAFVAANDFFDSALEQGLIEEIQE